MQRFLSYMKKQELYIKENSIFVFAFLKNEYEDTQEATHQTSNVNNLSLYVSAESLQSCLTLCDPIDGSLLGSCILLVNINFVKGKKSFKEKHWVDARISRFRVSQAYLVATYRCGNLYQMASAWDGPSRHPHGVLQAWASALQAQRGYLGFHIQKIFVCGEMIKFRMKKWVN